MGNTAGPAVRARDELVRVPRHGHKTTSQATGSKTIGTAVSFVGLPHGSHPPALVNPGSASGYIAGAECPEVANQPIHIPIGESQPLGIHHRLGQTGPHQGIADIVHIEKALTW